MDEDQIDLLQDPRLARMLATRKGFARMLASRQKGAAESGAAAAPAADDPTEALRRQAIQRQMIQNIAARFGGIRNAPPASETDDQAMGRQRLTDYLATQRDPRFARMLAARQSQSDPNADTPRDIARKAYMDRLTLIGDRGGTTPTIMQSGTPRVEAIRKTVQDRISRQAAEAAKMRRETPGFVRPTLAANREARAAKINEMIRQRQLAMAAPQLEMQKLAMQAQQQGQLPLHQAQQAHAISSLMAAGWSQPDAMNFVRSNGGGGGQSMLPQVPTEVKKLPGGGIEIRFSNGGVVRRTPQQQAQLSGPTADNLVPYPGF